MRIREFIHWLAVDFLLLAALTCCSSGGLNPNEFCEEWSEAICAEIVRCSNATQAQCVEAMRSNFLPCAEWSEALCGSGQWSEHNADRCIQELPELTCNQLSFGLLPRECNHICLER